MKCHRGAKRGGLLFLRRLFFLFTDGELLQVVGGAVVDVQIHIARDAINLATVGELPKVVSRSSEQSKNGSVRKQACRDISP